MIEHVYTSKCLKPKNFGRGKTPAPTQHFWDPWYASFEPPPGGSMVWSGEFYVPNPIHIEATYLRLNPTKKNLVVVELVMGLYRQYHIFGARKCSHHDPELIPKNQLNNPMNPVQWVNQKKSSQNDLIKNEVWPSISHTCYQVP